MSWKALGVAVTLAAAAAFLSASLPTVAQAQVDCSAVPDEDGGNECVNAAGKGTIGLGLIGAELGFIIPALAGLDDTWAFIVFPVVGAVGGGVAGYFLLDQPDHPEIAVTVLAVGMAAVIPTMVITLSATAYDPEEEEAVERLEDEEPVGPDPDEEMMQMEGGGSMGGSTEPAPAPAAEPPAAPATGEPTSRAPGTGLFRWTERGLFLGAPAVSFGSAYSREEVFRYGARQRAEVHVPVLSATF